MLLTGLIALASFITTLADAVSIRRPPDILRTRSPSAVTGYVQTSGQSFTLDSEVFTVVGANSYWVGLTGLNTSEMDQAFADIAGAGATAVRTWGFNDVTSPSGDYYQLWTNGVPTINYGATGLENFDNVVATAKANGLRLIVALTNNWDNYGGMDVYVSQLTGTDYHDYFYTNTDVIAAYKNYVNVFVSRYGDEPGILAWELANEPRCAGSTGVTSGNCTATTITTWIEEMSAYIHSIDSNHLVAIGDEGFYDDPSSSDYPYQGGEGINFTANLAIPTVDFGTVHLYPLSWGETSDPIDWGVQWIDNHAASQKAQNKPVILEEFGITDNMTETYEAWYSAIVSSGLTGDLIWQAGSYLASGATPNDGYAVYPNDTVYALEAHWAAELKARNAE
ncbi:glycoside hydrolase family 5 protein [Laetiporus sulphureus 93-53]|uniref:mannan endo-1,4-beta-mannosidase n=1 Tax=Laetiporus sulphureus 93-53 TaxID=1314785 RepID=A0A165GPN9_9APHY|nr:glycoside hydrolase family 5 protein [Laetiporus sulphureus 93-53]KZT10635.1 glycoside hydrolase family 5 protein [Laetiporus sulphureus 93-53]